ncbi:hypothetical protein GA0111570_108133 [Raineyella antarctica]|uniref:Cellulose synthase n=1 Tax=Raineyella antarctica TaxID=1577474 RepID=A0A1G6HC75_9ACTN|nr:hypothetical protein [Raineyella antarctica]SDB91907.1 hypothetical protein GA0111570_108133 [Raineyella antarctica]
MNPADVLLIACLALVVIGLVYTLIAWRAGYGAGHVLEGLGLAGLSVGLYLSGLMQLAYDLLAALVAWGRALVWTTQVQAGIGALAVAVVLWVVAGALNRRGIGVLTKQDRAERRQARVAARADKKGADPATARPSAARTATTTPAAAQAKPAARPGAAPGAGKAGQDDDLDEIEAILRKRGIN